jgi:hypothetical protein
MDSVVCRICHCDNASQFRRYIDYQSCFLKESRTHSSVEIVIFHYLYESCRKAELVHHDQELSVTVPTGSLHAAAVRPTAE